MKIIVTRSSKGGVGKTLFSTNISAVFNANGVKTALVDADDQATTMVFTGSVRNGNIEEMKKDFTDRKNNPQNYYNSYHSAINVPILKEKLERLEVYKKLIVGSIDLKEQLRGIAAKERLEKTIDNYRKQGVEVLIFDLKGEHSDYTSYLASRADLTLLVSDNGLYSLMSVFQHIIEPNKGRLGNYRTLIVNRFKYSKEDKLNMNVDMKECLHMIEQNVSLLGEMSNMAVYRQCSEKGFGVVESFDKKESMVKAQKEIEGLAMAINDIIKVR
ncbi:AAA family ATPase [Pseudomonas chlororaphis]